MKPAAWGGVRFHGIGATMIDVSTALVLVLALVVGVARSQVARSQTVAALQTGAESPKATPLRGLDVLAIDKTADPCADFYQYACGNWIKGNPVPPDQVRWVRSFSLLQERNLDELGREMARAAAHPASPLEKQYGDFFASCMDVEDLQEKGLEPIRAALDRISALKDSKGVATLLADLAASGDSAPLFGLDVVPAPQDSSKPILSITQGGLTLPDRENYGGDSPYVFKRYRGHITRVFILTGETLKQADDEAMAVLAIEKSLAQAFRNRVESTDPDKRYHVMTLADLAKLTPDFDFRSYLGRMTPLPSDTLNVVNPDFLKTVDHLIASVPIDAWKSYLRWHVLSERADSLPKEFRDENFAFWGANVGHQEKPAPRIRQCAAITDQAFGEAFAQQWVERHFSSTTQAGTARLVDALEKALAAEIRTLPWMNEETKGTAERKLAAIQTRIGHPQKWRDYSGLTVDRHDFVGNLRRDAVFERTYLLGRLGRPVDPGEWDMTATDLDIRYAGPMNSLTIPAGILQPPFFDDAADPAVNFGAIGVLAAHELTHGFDGIGSKFDEHGNFRDWQTPDDRREFAAATSCEVAQYTDSLPKSDDPGDPPKVNSLTVAESSADDGALRIALRALKDALVEEGRAADHKIDGLTESQRFFLSFAQGSCENQTFLSARRSMTADPHSSGRVRVNNAVQNFEEFGKAFQCAKGKPMNPGRACRVW